MSSQCEPHKTMKKFNLNEFIKGNEIKYFVSATDNSFQWGNLDLKTTKVVILCKSLEEAQEKAMDLNSMPSLNRIKIHASKPYYSPKSHHVEYYTSNLMIIKNIQL